MFEVLRPCRLDRLYDIGEFVEEACLDPKAAGRLIRMGYIEFSQKTLEIDIVDDETSVCEPDDLNEENTDVQGEFDKLEDMKKDELLEMAQSLELDVKPAMNKSEMIAMIQASV